MIGALEDAEDYKAFEAAIIANYHAQSAVPPKLELPTRSTKSNSAIEGAIWATCSPECVRALRE